MSNAARDWACETPVRGVAKAVLNILANHADKDGKCWPSVARISRHCGFTERPVQAALRALEADGYIIVGKSNGHQSTYTLTMITEPNPRCCSTPVGNAPPLEQHPTPAVAAPPPPLEQQITPAGAAPESSRTLKITVIEPEAPTGPQDIRTELWREGLGIVRRLTGKGDGQARGIVGRLVGACRDDCASALRILREAESLRPIDPVAWLTRAAAPQPKIRNGFIAMALREQATIDHDEGTLFPRIANVH